MSQDPEKFLYFKVGLLKDSNALDALWQDALKHHMVDQPDKLIALRLTEYYELVAKGILHPVAKVSQATLSVSPTALVPPTSTVVPVPAQNYADDQKQTTRVSAPIPSSTNHIIHSSQPKDHQISDDNLVSAPAAEQNAEDAADYWSLL